MHVRLNSTALRCRVALTNMSRLTTCSLRPTVGLNWYFFAEMFDHFRPFFLMVFSVRAFAHCVDRSPLD